MQTVKEQQPELLLERLEAIEEKYKDQEWRVYLAAKEYINLGVYVVPVDPGKKRLPYVIEDKDRQINYSHASNKPKTIEKWFNPSTGIFKGYNIGIAGGRDDGCFIIDVDVKEDINGHETLQYLEEKHGKLPTGPVAETPNGGKHYLFRWQENAICSQDRLGKAIDTRGGDWNTCQGHVNAWPSIVNGKMYKWVQGGELPLLPSWVCDKMGIPFRPKGYGRGNENVTDDDLEIPIKPGQIESMLKSIDPDDLSYDEWLRVGLSIKSQMPDEDGLILWDKWSQGGDRYERNECARRWNGFSDFGTVRGGTLFHYAKNAGWEPDKDKGERSGNPLDEIVDRINKEFAITIMGGKIRIIRERTKADRETQMHYDLMDKTAFEVLMGNQVFETNRGKKIPISNIWFAHEGRRTYANGIGLFPDGKVEQGYFNTWYGFSVNPVKGDCDLFLKHIEEIVCDGNKDHYEWLLDWCADLVQDPAHPKGCAVVMRSGEGAGKGTFANTIGDLFGPHHRHLIDDSHLTSNFNAHLFDAITVFADEITWGGNRKTAGKLKGMVTERTLVGERKGVDPVVYTNRIHLLVASNGQWVVPAGADSRRWFVLDVSDEKARNMAYFKRIHEELNNGGKEAFLHFLLEREISVNLRSAPTTQALKEQRILNTQNDTVLNWWLGNVIRGTMPVYDVKGKETDWPSQVTKSDFHESYENWCERRKMRSMSISVFAKEMMKYGVRNGRPSINGKRTYVFIIPPHKKCKEKLNAKYEGILGESDDKDNVSDSRSSSSAENV